ncbi:MAG: hypothetical protein DRH70_02930 [Candidatus Coatesbacteria bacterium]|nr:MAG: hypothetical protein DRH70_02930 [Candidatus Coatesbacteria bacterium]
MARRLLSVRNRSWPLNLPLEPIAATDRDGLDHDLSLIRKDSSIGWTFWFSRSGGPDIWQKIDIYCKMKMCQMKCRDWIAVLDHIPTDGATTMAFRIYRGNIGT